MRFLGLQVLYGAAQKEGLDMKYVAQVMRDQTGITRQALNDDQSKLMRRGNTLTYSVLASPESTFANLVQGVISIGQMGGLPSVINGFWTAAALITDMAKAKLSKQPMSVKQNRALELAFLAGETEQEERSYQSKLRQGQTLADKRSYFTGAGDKGFIRRTIRATENTLQEAPNLVGFSFVETPIRAATAQAGADYFNMLRKVYNDKNATDRSKLWASEAVYRMGLPKLSLSETDQIVLNQYEVQAARYFLKAQPQQPSKAPLNYPTMANSTSAFVRSFYAFSSPFYTTWRLIADNYKEA
jgi:hypothetical protein